MSKITITVKNLTVFREEKCVFKNLSFTASSNKPVYIAGQNGCGKTSLLRTIAGLLPPFRGEIIFEPCNLEVTKTYLSHDNSLYDHLTIKENLNLWRHIEGLPSLYTDIFEISEFENMYPYQLSQGQKKRAYLTKLIGHHANILLLDEVFSDLDIHMISALTKAFENWRKQNKLIFYTSHIPINNITPMKIELPS